MSNEKKKRKTKHTRPFRNAQIHDKIGGFCFIIECQWQIDIILWNVSAKMHLNACRHDQSSWIHSQYCSLIHGWLPRECVCAYDLHISLSFTLYLAVRARNSSIRCSHILQFILSKTCTNLNLLPQFICVSIFDWWQRSEMYYPISNRIPLFCQMWFHFRFASPEYSFSIYTVLYWHYLFVTFF